MCSAFNETMQKNESIHVIYAGDYYQAGNKFHSFIKEAMQKLTIKKLFLTYLSMQKRGIITEKTMNSIYDTTNQNNNWWYIGNLKPTRLSEYDHSNIVAIENAKEINSNDFLFTMKSQRQAENNVPTVPSQLSVTDDLELFIEQVSQNNLSTSTQSSTYFLPKLTSEELDFVDKLEQLELIDQNYASKYVFAQGSRRTLRF